MTAPRTHQTRPTTGVVVEVAARTTRPARPAREPRRPLVRRPLADRCRRLARRVTRVLVAVVVVRLAVELVGVPLVAVVLGLVLVVAALRWWARVAEPWLFAPRSPRTRQSERPARTRAGDAPAEMDHVAFARALAVVTDRYRMECERQAAAAVGPKRGGWS